MPALPGAPGGGGGRERVKDVRLFVPRRRMMGGVMYGEGGIARRRLRREAR